MWSESTNRRKKKQMRRNLYAFDDTFQCQATSGTDLESQYSLSVPIYQRWNLSSFSRFTKELF